MKKLLWLGVGVGIFVLFSAPILALSLKDTSEIQQLSNHSAGAASNKSVISSRDRVVTIQEIQPRWRGTDAQGNTEILGFSSTFAANLAASFMQNQGYTLSFTSFGRAPFQQLLIVSKDGLAQSVTTTSSRAVAALPEPTTLLLLGSGLAALAAGLRKRKKRK